MDAKTLERNQNIYKATEDLATLTGEILVVNDRTNALSHIEGTRWNRFSMGKKDGAVLLKQHFDQIVLRIDTNKEVLRILAKMCNAMLPEGSPIWLVGGNDEGIKSVTTTLKGILTNFETKQIKQRNRVILAKSTGEKLLELPLTKQEINILGEKLEWIVSPSAFAKGKLDKGTAFLLEYLKKNKIKRSLQLADFASGTGVLTYAIRAMYPEAHIDGIEADAWALEASKQNVQNIHWLLSDGWTKMPRDRRYDLVVSNPPVHFGKSSDFSILEGFIAGLKERMHRKGKAWVVLQSHVFLPKFAGQAKTEIIAEGDGYRIWEVRP